MFSRMAAGMIPKVDAKWLFLLVFLLLAVDPPARFQPVLELAVVVVAFPLCVLLAIGNEPRSRLESKACAFLGEASYGVYLLHWPALVLFILADHGLGLKKTPLVGATLMVLVVLAASFLNRFFDAPLRRTLRSKIAVA
jgi:peptidoglycan/LPS O-acetylase OafA/YrhL